MKWVNPFQPSVAFHIETSHLICNANQMTGFYIECNTGLKWLNGFRVFDILRSSLKRDSLLTLSIENKSQVCFEYFGAAIKICICDITVMLHDYFITF